MDRCKFVCSSSAVGLWLGAEGGLWLEVHLFVMLVLLVFGWVQEVVCGKRFICL